MTTRIVSCIAAALLILPGLAVAQQNVPPAVQRTAADAEAAARRFGVGVQGGIGLDPELIDFGAHATFGPLFRPSLQVRPGIEFGLGELTTMFGINVDFLYTLSEFSSDSQWLPYVGGGPNFSLSHRGFEEVDDDRGRFDFSDTDFNGGMNFIVGMRKESGMFFEMKATAWGVANVRLLAGFNF